MVKLRVLSFGVSLDGCELALGGHSTTTLLGVSLTPCVPSPINATELWEKGRFFRFWVRNLLVPGFADPLSKGYFLHGP